MKKYRLEDFKKGWFIGDFNDTIHKTNQFEVAVKYYYCGEKDIKHFHKIATEFTVIVFGKVRMNGITYYKGDILKIEPYFETDFEALEETCTAVIKIPGVLDDKYLSKCRYFIFTFEVFYPITI